MFSPRKRVLTDHGFVDAPQDREDGFELDRRKLAEGGGAPA